MTSLIPGQRPPHVTIPADTPSGSKKICLRGPAISKLSRGRPPRMAASISRGSEVAITRRPSSTNDAPATGDGNAQLPSRVIARRFSFIVVGPPAAEGGGRARIRSISPAFPEPDDGTRSRTPAARRASLKGVPWKRWGPYLSERQWGTVREDYSQNGDAWNHFTHDQARSRAYHWGEDGHRGLSATTRPSSASRSPSGTAAIRS